MKQITTKAILLKRLNFSEADRIITVITPDNGKVSMLAKGVRRAKSKLAGGIELFSVSDITFIDGKSDLKTIVSTRLDTHFRKIVTNLQTTTTAYALMKLTDNYTEHVDEAKLYFDILHKSLHGLDTEPAEYRVVFVWFAVQLLQESGSGINLERPLKAAAFLEDETYGFSYDDMSFYQADRGVITANHIKFLRLVARASEPAKLKIIKNYQTLSTDLYQILEHTMKLNRT